MRWGRRESRGEERRRERVEKRKERMRGQRGRVNVKKKTMGGKEIQRKRR